MKINGWFFALDQSTPIMNTDTYYLKEVI